MNQDDNHADRKNKILEGSGTLNPNSDKVIDKLFQDKVFFDKNDILQVKYEMLRCVKEQGRSVSKAVQDFGFSRRNFYKIQSRFEEAGFQGLISQKRGPKTPHKLGDEVMEFVIKAIEDDTTLKAPALSQLVQQKFQLKVHPRTIEKKLADIKKGQKK